MKRNLFFPRDRKILSQYPDISVGIQLVSLVLALSVMLTVAVLWKKDWALRGDLLIEVSGNSMSPLLTDGQRLYAEKRSDFQRQDLICFHAPEKAQEAESLTSRDLLIKRIIGLPGDKLTIESGGRIYINGEYLWEPYLTEEGRQATFQEFYRERIMEMTLGPREYFVLGDNRGDSLDSRYFGPVEESEIQAAVSTSPTKLLYTHYAALFLLGLGLPLIVYKCFGALAGTVTAACLRKGQAC